MECGIIYIRLVPSTKELEWIKYCHITGALPEQFQGRIFEVITYINDRYKDYMIVPMDYSVHPGCIVMKEFTDTIATETYERFDRMMKEYTDQPSIRCVCSVGEVTNPYSEKTIQTTWGKGLVKVGRYLDLSFDSGLYAI